MRPIVYIISLKDGEKLISINIKTLHQQVIDYCNKNNIDCEKLSITRLQNITLGRTKNKYNFIEKIERIPKEEYVKDELQLRYGDCLEHRKCYYIGKILQRRGIN